MLCLDCLNSDDDKVFVLRLLYEAGYNLNQLSCENETVLMYAFLKKGKSVAKFLIEESLMDLTVKNANGQNASQLAASLWGVDYVPCLKRIP